MATNRKEYNKKWHENNPNYNREWYYKNREKRIESQKRAVLKLKDNIFERYGNCCACCNESHREFLIIDHIDGGGNKHRKEMTRNGQAIYHWLRKNNYPEGFQILCANCNMAKAFNSMCPHKKITMRVFVSPHPDDAVLFATYTILREKPLVVTVTHPTFQGDNGEERVIEDYNALRILGAPIAFFGIDEDKLTEEVLREKLQMFPSDTVFYIPEYEKDGNPHHNIVHDTVRRMTDNYKEYKTYSGWLDRSGDTEVIPAPEELELKKRAMACYQTQIQNPNTAHYFETYAEYV